MEIIKELERNFGIVVNISNEPDKKGLPRYLSSGREILRAQNDDISFVIVKISDAFDSRLLSKELAIYEEKYNVPVAIWFDTLTKNYRNAYVKHHIPFIMLTTQIYLPFMGILFSKKFVGEKRKTLVPLTPNAQKILFYLMCEERKGYSKKQLSDILGMDQVYVTRGTKELIDRNYISEQKQGKYTFTERKLSSVELFEKASNSFINPISKVIYVKRTKEVMSLPKASDYALSEISMLNPPEIETYACYKKSDIVKKFEIVDESSWEDPNNICKIELWKYDPNQLVNNDIVDKLSLYCSLIDSKDERVQGELKKIIEKI